MYMCNIYRILYLHIFICMYIIFITLYSVGTDSNLLGDQVGKDYGLSMLRSVMILVLPHVIHKVSI
jgi:hypothetical protein